MCLQLRVLARLLAQSFGEHPSQGLLTPPVVFLHKLFSVKESEILLPDRLYLRMCFAPGTLLF